MGCAACCPMHASWAMTRAAEYLRLTAVLLLAVGQAAGAGDADMEARRLLGRVAEASRSLDYVGTFVYRNGDWMESMRIIHRAGGVEGARSRLVSLGGEPREVIRDANRVTCILPDEASVRVSKSKPRGVTDASLFNPSGEFVSHYTLGVATGTRVAGRATDLVTLMPGDRYRYGYRLFVDQETGFLLKSELVDAQGMPLEQIVYTTLEFPAAIPDALLEPGVSGEDFTWYISDAPATESEDSRWQVGWLPSGFRMRDRASDPAALGRMPVEHLVYTDGLASVSVFIEHLEAAGEHQEGTSRMGAVNAFGTMVESFQVTVVGEVPEVTVERIGRSVSRR